MPGINEVISKLAKLLDNNEDHTAACTELRSSYIKELTKKTDRNVIIYYSAWLQSDTDRPLDLSINDMDKIGFMNSVHELDRSKGLDLVLHTPGGDLAATESLVDYLREMFNSDIRAIVPQIAMSAGTMMACACKEIIMGKQSNLGPIDPLLNGIPVRGILEEFEKAALDIAENEYKIPLWQMIISKYKPTLLGECEHAEKLSDEIVTEWLSSGMFKKEKNKNEIIKNIKQVISSHEKTRTHSRHISAKKCKELGLKVKMMEEEQKLQDIILDLHYSCILTFMQTPNIKIIQNNQDKQYIISDKEKV